MVETSGAEAIAAERQRQVEVEGWTPVHDDEHDHCELIRAALVYADNAWSQVMEQRPRPSGWPWPQGQWRPSDEPIRNLVKAGALIAAEIDRLQRASRPIVNSKNQ